MKYFRNIQAAWTSSQERYLKEKGINFITGGLFRILEDENYFDLLKTIKDAEGFSDVRVLVEFEEDEYTHFNKFMFNRGYALAGHPFTDSYPEWMDNAFDGFCPNCLLPNNEQLHPFILAKKVSLPKKHIFFTMSWAQNYLFTDKTKYEDIFKPLGIGFKPVLIGKSKSISTDIVQLEIPISPYKLVFGKSEFGRTWSWDGSEKFVYDLCLCPLCSKPTYCSYFADYFPDFEQDFDFHIVHTQEFFGPHHQIILSRKFAEFLVERKIAKWDSSYFIPVKKFESS